MKGTKEKIQEKALALFNENGIEYVGMRELAATLDMRIGNITYYFPTKDDLVFSLTYDFATSNSQIHKENPVKSLYDFLARSRKLFINGVSYRCLMLSIVHIMDQNKLVSDHYKKLAQTRRSALGDVMKTLVEGKYLSIAGSEVEWFLVSIHSLLNRFWYSEAAVDAKRSSLDTQVDRYLKLQAYLFKPYVTKKGMKDIERFLEEHKLG